MKFSRSIENGVCVWRVLGATSSCHRCSLTLFGARAVNKRRIAPRRPAADIEKNISRGAAAALQKCLCVIRGGGGKGACRTRGCKSPGPCAAQHLQI